MIRIATVKKTRISSSIKKNNNLLHYFFFFLYFQTKQKQKTEKKTKLIAQKIKTTKLYTNLARVFSKITVTATRQRLKSNVYLS